MNKISHSLIILKKNIGGKNMSLLKDEKGQGAAEYILLFGGVIVIAIAALIIYQQYFQNTNLNSEQDVHTVRNSVTAARG
jgi:uncharacterized protein (UPF0333 family)